MTARPGTSTSTASSTAPWPSVDPSGQRRDHRPDLGRQRPQHDRRRRRLLRRRRRRGPDLERRPHAEPDQRHPQQSRSRPPRPTSSGVWNMNEGTGTSLADNSGNAITGAAVGSPTWVPGFAPTRRRSRSPTATARRAGHGQGRGGAGRPRQRQRRRRQSAHGGARHERHPRHAEPGRQRRLHLYPDVRLHRPRQLHLQGQRRDPQLEHRHRLPDGRRGATNLALQLNGTTQYATLGTTSQLRSATFTVELWFKRTGAGVGTNTGTGGIADAIPLITKGRAEGETAAEDINYFLGIDASSGKLVADFEEGQTGATPSLNHPITATTVVTRTSGTTPRRRMTARPGTSISTASSTAPWPSVRPSRPTPRRMS